MKPFATAALVLTTVAARWSGRALARGDQEARDIHRLAAAGAIAFSAVSAIAGFVLLP